jgi:hypothetical protein
MRSLLLIGLVLSGLAGEAQDKVITLNGDTINCRILDFNGVALTFSMPPGDSVCYKLASQIYQLLYSNGQIQNISQRILISGEKDWEKVIITYDSTDVDGLVRVGELKTKTYTSNDEEQALMKGQIKLKKEAAKMGASVVLITKQFSRGRNMYVVLQYDDAKAVYHAIAYTYRN